MDIHLKIKVVTTLFTHWFKKVRLDIHLKIKVVTTAGSTTPVKDRLDIHLKIKAVTTYKLELDEFQLYIIKIK